ncbi:OmpH family outer membrane protein [Bacteroidota bacterium]
MKKLIAVAIVAFVFTAATIAQKFAFVDTDYIMKNIPSYVAAQDEIDKMSENWETEITAEYDAIAEMYKTYQAERVLLSDEMKKKREDEIVAKEKQVKELQNKYFGPEGDLFNKREELVKPIQDALYKAIKELTIEGGFAIIFDTASGASILYSNPKFDKSDEVLQRLGYKN